MIVIAISGLFSPIVPFRELGCRRTHLCEAYTYAPLIRVLVTLNYSRSLSLHNAYEAPRAMGEGVLGQQAAVGV